MRIILFFSNRKIIKKPKSVLYAAKGNHAQSVGFAARQYAIPTKIVVPLRNSIAKNKAMLSLGVKLFEHGDDFQSALELAIKIARENSMEMIPSYDTVLVTIVTTYSL